MSVMIKIMLSSTVVLFALVTLEVVFGVLSDITLSDWIEKIAGALLALFFTVFGISISGFLLTLIWGW